MTFQESTNPLLRPAQAMERREEAERIRHMLKAPPHIAGGVDRGQLARNLRAMERDLETQEPRRYSEAEIDPAVARSNQLKEEILQGMPTQEEMRRNPPGAVDKHRNWEKRNKKKLTEWKNIQLRLHKNDATELADATDIANFERFRPTGGSQQLNMDNAQIPGKTQFGPKPGAGPAVVFTGQEVAALEAADPEIADRLAMMSNEHRAMVKQFIRTLPGNAQASSREKRKRNLSPEQRKAIGERLKAAREAKKQEG